MSRDERILRFLARGGDVDDAIATVAATRADPELRRWLAEQAAVEELLSSLLAPPSTGFVDRVRARTTRLASSSRFVREVVASTRVRRRPRHRSPLIFMAIAAAALIAVAIAFPWGTGPAIARMDAAEHATVRHADGVGEPARSGMALRLGDEVAAGDSASGTVAITRADGTRLRVDPGTRLRLEDAVRARLLAGTLHVDVPHRPGTDGDRLTVLTEAADVHVNGTRFAVSADALSTTLVMEEGTARFANRHGSIDVAAPRSAHATGTAAPAFGRPWIGSRKIVFQPPALPVEPGALPDSGDEYDPARGYGWLGPKDGAPIPGLTFTHAGVTTPVRAGRDFGVPSLPPVLRIGLAVGWNTHAETWWMDLPNGRYRVAATVGDPSSDQGPHQVRIQGVPVVDQVMTAKGEWTERGAAIVVADGRLVMEVGGGDTGLTGQDGSSDTYLISLVVERIE